MDHTARGVFLAAGWTFAAYNFFGMAVGVLADLPPCNGEACSTAGIAHQAYLAAVVCAAGVWWTITAVKSRRAASAPPEGAG